MDQARVRSIEETKSKISNDIIKRRSILSALTFTTQTNFLNKMNHAQFEMGRDLSNHQLLLFNLLREAPKDW